MYSRLTLVGISINLNSSQLNMFREIIFDFVYSFGRAALLLLVEV